MRGMVLDAGNNFIKAKIARRENGEVAPIGKQLAWAWLFLQ